MKKVFLLLLLFFPIFLPLQNAKATSSWSTTTLDSAGFMGFDPSMAIGSDGFARISYFDGTARDLKYVQCTNVSCSTNVTTIVDDTGFIGMASSLALGSDGFARITYYDDSNDDLKYAQCTNASCSTKNITAIDETGNVGQTSSIAIGSDGFARISYYDTTNGDLKIAQCTNASCSSKNITTIDATDNMGANSSIVIGTDGYARIAYNGSSQLKLVRCTNDSCSTNVITAISTTATSTPSMILSNSNIPSIAAWSGSGVVIKFILCSDHDCTGMNEAIVGSTHAQYPSLEIGSDGYPRISFTDADTNEMKYLQCTNSTCTTNTTTIVDTAASSGSLVVNGSNLSISYMDSNNFDLKYANGIEIPDPTPTPAPTTQQSSNSNSSSHTQSRTNPICTQQSPGTPDLFEIRTNRNQATLFFAPSSNATNYIISYGLTPNDKRFSITTNQNNSSGVLSYTINALSPQTNYFYTVRALNNCMPGNWSNIMQASTNKKQKAYYKNLLIKVLGATGPQESTRLSDNKYNQTIKTPCQTYTVKSGDSLWSIAENMLGSGSKYTELLKLNGMTSDQIHTGEKVKINC